MEPTTLEEVAEAITPTPKKRTPKKAEVVREVPELHGVAPAKMSPKEVKLYIEALREALIHADNNHAERLADLRSYYDRIKTQDKSFQELAEKYDLLKRQVQLLNDLTNKI